MACGPIVNVRPAVNRQPGYRRGDSQSGYTRNRQNERNKPNHQQRKPEQDHDPSNLKNNARNNRCAEEKNAQNRKGQPKRKESKSHATSKHTSKRHPTKFMLKANGNHQLQSIRNIIRKMHETKTAAKTTRTQCRKCTYNCIKHIEKNTIEDKTPKHEQSNPNASKRNAPQ